MNAKYLIFGGLAATAIVVAILLFTGDGDGAAETAPVAAEGGSTAVAVVTDTADTAGAAGDSAVAGADAPSPGRDGAPAGDPDAPVSSGVAPGDAGSAGAGGPGTARDRGTGAGTADPDAEPGSAGATGSAQDGAEVAEVLRATARAYGTVRSMQAGFVQQLENTLLGRTVRSAGTLYQRQPDRFLMRFSDPRGDVIVSDGQYFWLYFPSTDPDQVVRTRRGARGLDLQSQFIGDPVERFAATYHGREQDRGHATHVISLVPRQPLGYEKLKVWIDAEDHLIRRFDLTEGNGIVRHFVLDDLELNPSLPDRLFQFTPPEGARVVSQG